MRDDSPERWLAEFVASLGHLPLPAPTRARAGTALLDWFSAGWAGADAPQAEAVRTLARSQHGDGAAGVFGTTGRLSPAGAAFANAAISHLREMDDGHRGSMLHPGIVAIPAPLALACMQPVSAARLTAAIVAGYEVAIRVGTALGRGHYALCHSTATAGSLGAAAAAGVMLGLDGARMQHALAIAATQAAGLWQFSDDHEYEAKPLHPAFAVRNGMAAAFAAQQGFPGARRFFNGARGLYAVLHGDGDAASLDRDLGAGFMIETTTIKNWPVCGQIFTALDALQALLDEQRVAADDVESLQVRIYPQALDVAKVDWPHGAAEGAFSLRWGLARLLAFGRLVDADTHDGALRALGKRIEVLPDADYGKQFPQQRPCTVTLRTRDGRERSATRSLRRGDPEDPLTRADLVARFRAAVPQAGDARIQAIADWCDAATTSDAPTPLAPPDALFV